MIDRDIQITMDEACDIIQAIRKAQVSIDSLKRDIDCLYGKLCGAVALNGDEQTKAILEPVENLKISDRTKRALKNEGITNVAALLSLGGFRVRCLCGIGEKSLADLRQELNARGFSVYW